MSTAKVTNTTCGAHVRHHSYVQWSQTRATHCITANCNI